MANGDLIIHKSNWRSVLLLDALVATNVGLWVPTHGYDQASIEVAGIVTATVNIHASNAAALPDPSDVGVIRTTMTADGEVTYDVLPRWMKASISAWTEGTISVFAVLRSRGGGMPR